MQQDYFQFVSSVLEASSTFTHRENFSHWDQCFSFGSLPQKTEKHYVYQ
jgi:hypothetical protein